MNIRERIVNTIKNILLSIILPLLITTICEGEKWTQYGSSNEIRDIKTDGEYVWCATSHGVVRWNSTNLTYTSFTTDNGLLSNNITSIAVAPDHTIWAGTEHGLSIYNGSSWDTFTSDNGIAGNNIIDVAIGADSVVWVSTKVSGDYYISRYENVSWETFRIVYPVGARSLSVGPDNTLWIGGGNVSLFDGKEWRTYTRINPSGSSNVITVSVGPDGIVWAGATQAVFRFDGETWTEIKPYISQFQANAVTVGPDNVLWVGSAGGISPYQGLYNYNGSEWIKYEIPYSTLSAYVETIDVTDSGVVFVGTKVGLYRFDHGEWTMLKTSHDLANTYITCIDVSPDNAVWVGTKEGLSRFTGENWENYTTVNGLSSNDIYDLAAGSDGTVWVITASKDDSNGRIVSDISLYDNGEWINFHPDSVLVGHTVCDMSVDMDGNVWFASGSSGISRFDGVNKTTFKLQNSACSIAVGADNFIWAGTRYGVMQYDGKVWTSITKGTCLDEKAIYFLGVEGDAVFAADRNEVYRYINGRWEYTDHGFFSINSLDLRSSSGLWVGAMNSVYRYDGLNWNQFLIMDKYNSDYSESFIAIDSQDIIWICVPGLGLVRLEVPPSPIGVDNVRFVPMDYKLCQNHPNPFNSSTTISYTLPKSSHVRLVIHNINGQEITSLVSDYFEAGDYEITWDASGCASGVYFCRLEAEGIVKTVKMLLLR